MDIPLPFPSMQDMTPPPPESAPAPLSTRCGACKKEAKNMCLRCERVVYCGPACQKEDWKFHKRICEKPKPAAAPPPPQAEAASAASVGGSGAAAAPPAAVAAAASSSSSSSASAPSKNTEVVRDEDLDEEDRAALAAVKKTGYRVHWRKAEEEAAIRSAIGDIAPKRIEAAAAAAGGGAGGAAAGASSAAPSAAPSASASATATTSAWNAAGTMEQRHMGEWLFDRLRGLLAALPAAALPSGGGTLRCTGEVTNVGDSTADILMARGKTKRVYDLRFSVVVEHAAAEAEASGARATALLHLNFLDVSNDTAGDRRFKVEFVDASKPGAAAQEGIRAALSAQGADAAGGLARGAVKAVEDAVAAFLLL